MGKLLSTTEVATRLGITVPRVQTFIWEGRLPAQKVGRSYAVDEDDLALVAHRPPGRPKAKPDEGEAEQGTVVEAKPVAKKRAAKKGAAK